MKTIGELRNILRFQPQEVNSSISYFADHCNLDFNVYLPTKGRNLQRDYVWTIEQKRELIWSILMNRHIPRMAMVNIITNKEDTNGTYQVIDGKQRLSTMIGFYRGEFDLIIDGESYYFSDLPEDYRRVISGYMFPYYIVNEDFGNELTDEDKITWFRYINFAGTPQDAEHLKGLIQKDNMKKKQLLIVDEPGVGITTLAIEEILKKENLTMDDVVIVTDPKDVEKYKEEIMEITPPKQEEEIHIISKLPNEFNPIIEPLSKDINKHPFEKFFNKKKKFR
jgi:uncharacterized protein with ParB-like and HNH nuclease domain